MDKRARIKELIAEMQKGGKNVNSLVKELMALKKELGDPVPSISSSKLSGDWKLTRKESSKKSKPKRKKKAKAKKSKE